MRRGRRIMMRRLWGVAAAFMVRFLGRMRCDMRRRRARRWLGWWLCGGGCKSASGVIAPSLVIRGSFGCFRRTEEPSNAWLVRAELTARRLARTYDVPVHLL